MTRETYNQTRGEPVVWLTSNPSLAPAAEQILLYQKAIRAGDASPECLEHRRVGHGDRTVMIEVDLSPNGKRLQRWSRWLENNGADMAAIKPILGETVLVSTSAPSSRIASRKSAAPKSLTIPMRKS